MSMAIKQKIDDIKEQTSSKHHLRSTSKSPLRTHFKSPNKTPNKSKLIKLKSKNKINKQNIATIDIHAN